MQLKLFRQSLISEKLVKMRIMLLSPTQKQMRRKVMSLSGTNRFTQIMQKEVKAVVARTLAEVTAKVGAAAKVLAKVLAKEVKENQKVRKHGDRADAVPVKMRLRSRRRMSVKRRSNAGRVAKRDIVSLNVLGLIHLWAWQV